MADTLPLSGLNIDAPASAPTAARRDYDALATEAERLQTGGEDASDGAEQGRQRHWLRLRSKGSGEDQRNRESKVAEPSNEDLYVNGFQLPHRRAEYCDVGHGDPSRASRPSA